MVYLTGDIHGSPWGVKQFCRKAKLSEKDTIVLLGDVSANYYGDERDNEVKDVLSQLKPMIDQSQVDASTEKWLDGIEERMEYSAWYCGHWHTDKRIDKLHFLFHSFETLEVCHPGKF